jgi:hypothetical protein
VWVFFESNHSDHRACSGCCLIDATTIAGGAVAIEAGA